MLINVSLTHTIILEQPGNCKKSFFAYSAACISSLFFLFDVISMSIFCCVTLHSNLKSQKTVPKYPRQKGKKPASWCLISHYTNILISHVGSSLIEFEHRISFEPLEKPTGQFPSLQWRLKYIKNYRMSCHLFTDTHNPLGIHGHNAFDSLISELFGYFIKYLLESTLSSSA